MPRTYLMDFPIDSLDMEQTIARIEQYIEEKRPRQHVVVNVAKMVEMRNDPYLREIVSSCDLI